MNLKACNIQTLLPGNPEYPRLLLSPVLGDPPRTLFAVGDVSLLRRDYIALFCSARCPGEVILKTYDLARILRNLGIAVVSGFHSPMERECLDLLLRGRQPVLCCPARSLFRMTLTTQWGRAIENQRLLLLSPFTEQCRRVTGLATTALIAHAAPDSDTERRCQGMLARGRRVFALDCASNFRIIRMGATPLQLMSIGEVLGAIHDDGPGTVRQ